MVLLPGTHYPVGFATTDADGNFDINGLPARTTTQGARSVEVRPRREVPVPLRPKRSLQSRPPVVQPRPSLIVDRKGAAARGRPFASVLLGRFGLAQPDLESVSPGTERTRRSPSWRCTMMRQETSSPSPVPSPTGLVVKKGSKICSGAPRGRRAGVGDLDEDQVAVAHRAHREGAGAGHGVQRVVDQLVHTGSARRDRRAPGERPVVLLDERDPSSSRWLNITRVESKPSCTSTHWCGVRSSCEYCFAESSSLEIARWRRTPR